MDSSAYRPDRDAMADLHGYAQGVLARLPPANPTDAWCPSPEQMETALVTAMWASVGRSEARDISFRIVLMKATAEAEPIMLARTLPVTAKNLIRIAPGVDTRHGSIGVGLEAEALVIWGTTLIIPHPSVIVEVIHPGTVACGVSHTYRRVVLRGPETLVIKESIKDVLRTVVDRWFAGTKLADRDEQVKILFRLVGAVQEQNHGGTLLLVPDENQIWRGGLQEPMEFGLSSPLESLGSSLDVLREAKRGQFIGDASATGRRLVAEEVSDRAVRALGWMSAVDGAVVIDRRLRLHGFGAKITASANVRTVKVFKPFADSQAEMTELVDLGGTRHQSAACFVAAFPETVAVVVSQDGGVSVFFAGERAGEVAALRGLELLRRWM